MILERVSVQVKPGHRAQVVEMLKAQRAKLDDPSQMRILTASIGPWWNNVVYEMTDANHAANEPRRQEWSNRSETPEFLQKWEQVVEGWTSKVWYVVED
jgi:hypothetical protein